MACLQWWLCIKKHAGAFIISQLYILKHANIERKIRNLNNFHPTFNQGTAENDKIELVHENKDIK